MFDFEDDASGREKCYTTIAQLPAFIDPKQPSTKKAPFSSILGHPFIHTVEVILPEDVYSAIQDSLSSSIPKIQYARVFMSLSSLLEGDFFNTYIKSGNILMISEGRSGTDNLFTLSDGVLKLELGREIFERTGLTGKVIRSGGRKHAKERYLIEIDLRQPSMLHGKKGFERIVWAFNNVLDQSVAWLFCDLSQGAKSMADGENMPLKKHHPQVIDCDPARIARQNVLTPTFQAMTPVVPDFQEDFQDSCGSLSEWLSMISLDSPRVTADDEVDPYLSRYAVPDVDCSRPSNLVSLKWHGLVPPRWVTQLYLLLLRETSRTTGNTWFALLSNALGKAAVEGKDGYAILTLPVPDSHPLKASSADDTTDGDQAPKQGRNFICWEFVGASVI